MRRLLEQGAFIERTGAGVHRLLARGLAKDGRGPDVPAASERARVGRTRAVCTGCKRRGSRWADGDHGTPAASEGACFGWTGGGMHWLPTRV